MSAQQTTDNFWAVWNRFKWQEPTVPVYRCYYVDNGDVDIYTMDQIPGNYIEITKEQYLAASKPARVIDGQLIVPKPRMLVQKLVPNANTGVQCHAHDVCVVVEQKGVFWNQQQHEIN